MVLIISDEVQATTALPTEASQPDVDSKDIIIEPLDISPTQCKPGASFTPY